MATLRVTTASDIVADDGQLSLREAIALAASGDTIEFGVAQIVSLNSTLRIAGKTLTIDGTGGGNQVKGSVISGQIVVAGNADVTITRATLVAISQGLDAPKNAEKGSDGTLGKSGLPGVAIDEPGANGKPGGHAQDGSDPSGTAKGMFGTIINLGNLTLDYVEVQGSATGGDGATGGFGGNGGGGGGGGDGRQLGKGGNGSSGGDGGSGTNGSAGADAMSGIWNLGNLVLKDSLIHGNTAAGGKGGDGGDGGKGGGGGRGGDGGFLVEFGQIFRGEGGAGGRGGNGGDGGNGGNGGSAYAGLLNEGRVIVKGAVIFYDNEATAGKGGGMGKAGEKGEGGTPGTGHPPGRSLGDGKAGAAGVGGSQGSEATDAIGAGPVSGSFGIDAHFHAFTLNQYLTVGQTVLDGTSAFGLSRSFSVSRFGDAFDTSSVGVGARIVRGDLNRNDFTGNTLPDVTLVFGNGGAVDSNKSFTLQLKAGFSFNDTSTIEFFLEDPSEGDLLGSDDTASFTLFKASNGNDVIRGTQGDRSFDSPSGFDGNDRLFGLSGDDVLSGDLGNDTLNGGAGIDTLFGGLGRDVMTGGAGGDQFNFSFVDHSTPTQRDLITDFSRAQGDKLRMTFDADTETAGFQRLNFIGSEAFGNEAGELRYSYVRQQDVTRVSADTNGDGVADFAFDLAGRIALIAADFEL